MAFTWDLSPWQDFSRNLISSQVFNDDTDDDDDADDDVADMDVDRPREVSREFCRGTVMHWCK